MKPQRYEIDPDQMTLMCGKESYVVDLPDGDYDIHLRWWADGNVVCWFNFDDARSVPVLDGKRADQTLRAKALRTVELSCEKKTTVCAMISYKDLNRADMLDYTPVEITPPPPGQIQLSHLISQAVQEQLIAMGVPTTAALQLDEDDNLEVDDEEADEFGSGYMEDEDFGDGPEEGTPGAGVPEPAESVEDDAGSVDADAPADNPPPARRGKGS